MLKINDPRNFRRTAAGLCLIAGPLVSLIGGLVTPWEQSETTAAYLQAMGENPARAQISAVLLYFGFLLIAVGIFGIIHLLRHRAVVLAHVAGVLAVWG
jgi:F0F1-type ATP synthase membrane subunit c/vacuolar-type H+-ATPase subunit K